VGNDGFLKHGKFTDEQFTNQAKEYGKMFAITRKQQYNDDLGALTALPKGIGRGGSLKFVRVFWTEFMENATFWAAGNSNIATGALALAGLNTANGVFVLLKDADGEYINTAWKYLVVPPVLMPTALSLSRAGDIQTGNTSSIPNDNPYAVSLSRLLLRTYKILRLLATLPLCTILLPIRGIFRRLKPCSLTASVNRRLKRPMPISIRLVSSSAGSGTSV
jgi:hypothetical protein